MKPKLEHLAEGIGLYVGDCLQVLPTLPDNSVDAVVTDPPYGLEFMGKEWDGSDGFRRSLNKADVGRDNVFGRMSKRGPEYRAGHLFQEWCEAWAKECLRVLKPGGHILAFGGDRTYHRLVCAIEDAGFEVRHTIAWVFGSGFPKSHDVSKAIDRESGAVRISERVGNPRNPKATGSGRDGTKGATRPWIEKAMKRGYHEKDGPVPVTAAAAWEGWGTALKPAMELIVLARKPLSEKTVAANVLKWGVGALNIDGCRIGVGDDKGVWPITKRRHAGRWPANIIHDGSEEVLAGFPESAGQLAYVGPEQGDRPSRGIYGDFGPRPPNEPRGDSGSAARFFYAAKADKDDRLKSKHPTVKPVDLIAYLCRLVTPPNGLVLDPFAGSGTLAAACAREGLRGTLIEREAEYVDDIKHRIEHELKRPVFFNKLKPVSSAKKARGFFE